MYLILKTTSLVYFSCCQTISDELNIIEFKHFAAELDQLILELDKRFSDFNTIRIYSDIFYNLFVCDIEKQPIETHLELCDLQSDLLLKSFGKVLLDFWKSVPKSRYPFLRDKF